MIEWRLFLVAWTLSFLMTGLVRRYAVSRSLMDTPNERSSHRIPTPRGGGIAIAASFFLMLLSVTSIEVTSNEIVWAMCGAGIWTALIGFFDDHHPILVRWRLIAHFIAAAWVLIWLHGLPSLVILGNEIDLRWMGYFVGAFYLVWLLNLFNFMDGIDGIAAVEVITVCLGGVVMYALANVDIAESVFPLLLSAAVAGFLFWNFPKAKIFMGDAGSGFLGAILGIFSIHSAWLMPELFWGWLILLGAFVVDATVTLLRRLQRGERIYEGHRNHAYQYAARKQGRHLPVTLAFGAINIFWLTPLAGAVAMKSLDGLVGLVIAYSPLIWLAFRYKAGAREQQEV